jgi:RimJ/RimL family protein N-acetyltransferase
LLPDSAGTRRRTRATTGSAQACKVVPELSDETVTLGGHTADDVPAHLECEDGETARRFGCWPRRSTEAGIRVAFHRWATEWQVGGRTCAFAVRDAATRGLVGGCELRIQSDGSAQVSYWTNARERGKGYATHALGLPCHYAASIGVARLEAHVAIDNYASQLVEEHAGFAAQNTFTEEDGQEMVPYNRALPAEEGRRSAQ